MELQEFIAQGNEVVDRLSRAIENRQIKLKEVVERVLQFVNPIGNLMVQEVLEGVTERKRPCFKYLRRKCGF
jgi:hypothetical protein